MMKKNNVEAMYCNASVTTITSKHAISEAAINLINQVASRSSYKAGLILISFLGFNTYGT